VNGRHIGDGPPRSQWPQIYADTYLLGELPLRRGRNVIAVACYNCGLAEHGRPPGTGVLRAQLSVKCNGGRMVKVATNSSWRVIPSPHQKPTAPRRMFTVGFSEICDLRRLPDGWNNRGFNDAAWQPAEVTAGRPDQPYSEVVACPLPGLVRVPTRPVAVGKCGYAGGTKGITGLPFEFCVFGPQDDEFYGGTFVWSPKQQKVALEFAADNRAALFVNNHRVLCQGWDDGFYNHLHYEADTYTGLHQGHGHRIPRSEVTLSRGWNSIGVAIGLPAETWGFVMRFADLVTGRTLPLRISPNRAHSGLPAWQVVCDGVLLNESDGMLHETPELNAGTFPSPSHLAAWEQRRGSRIAGADLLCKDGRAALKLPPKAFVTYRMPAELIGHIELEVRGEPGAVLDVTAGEALNPKGCVDSLRDRLFLTDRIILRKKWTRWRSFDRRAMRYIELAARNATRPVEVRGLRVDATHYPPPAPAEFKSSDRLLNKLWRVGLATLDACTQENFEDCPIREMAQWLGDAVVEGQVAHVAWGDEALTAKALRQFAADQPTDDWMRPIVPSGYGDKLCDYSLMYNYLLHRHWMYWGDRELLKDCFVAVNRLLTYAATFVDSAGLIRRGDDPKDMILLDHTLSRLLGDLDVLTGYQAAYAVGLKCGAEIAEALGRRAKAALWRQRWRQTRDSVVRRLFNRREGLFSDGLIGGKLHERVTATTNYWVLFAGLATRGQEEQMLKRLWPSPRREARQLWPPRENPYFKYFVLEALFSRGRWREAFAVLRSYYGPLLARKDAWTLFEMYDPRTPPNEPAGTASMCHAYGAGPLVHYFRWICGIRPTEPGYAAVVVEPQPGDLERLRTRLHTPRGEISLRLTKGRKGRNIVVSAPDEVAVELRPTYLHRGDRLLLA
ncbi:MAG: hypothetical protein GWP05_04960, partial [Anaerolineaceae bacterium]|nr:hypothetical protein [Anaerolineaceae bacterium]